MLYVALMKIIEGKNNEALAKRMQWQFPEGMNVVGQYWLGTPDPNVIVIFEADSNAPVMQFQADWNDYFEITIVLAITAEEGMETVKGMMG